MDYLTLEDVAKRLKVTRRTVYTYVRTGKLGAVRIGRYWRVSEEDLKDFLSNGHY